MKRKLIIGAWVLSALSWLVVASCGYILATGDLRGACAQPYVQIVRMIEGVNLK